MGLSNARGRQTLSGHSCDPCLYVCPTNVAKLRATELWQHAGPQKPLVTDEGLLLDPEKSESPRDWRRLWGTWSYGDF